MAPQLCPSLGYVYTTHELFSWNIVWCHSNCYLFKVWSAKHNSSLNQSHSISFRFNSFSSVTSPIICVPDYCIDSSSQQHIACVSWFRYMWSLRLYFIYRYLLIYKTTLSLMVLLLLFLFSPYVPTVVYHFGTMLKRVVQLPDTTTEHLPRSSDV